MHESTHDDKWNMGSILVIPPKRRSGHEHEFPNGVEYGTLVRCTCNEWFVKLGSEIGAYWRHIQMDTRYSRYINRRYIERIMNELEFSE